MTNGILQYHQVQVFFLLLKLSDIVGIQTDGFHGVRGKFSPEVGFERGDRGSVSAAADHPAAAGQSGIFRGLLLQPGDMYGADAVDQRIFFRVARRDAVFDLGKFKRIGTRHHVGVFFCERVAP